MGQIKDYLESKKKETAARSLEELHAAARSSVGNRAAGSVSTLNGADRERFDNDVRQNYAARQTASTTQKNAATAAQAAGKYYAQPAVNPEVNRLGNSLEVYKKNVEQKEAALNTANANAQRLYNTLKELENQGARLGRYSTSRLAMAKLDKVRQEYQQTYQQYQQAAEKAQTAYGEYTPAWEQYITAAKDFDTAYTAQQKAYTDWKSTVRTDVNAITAELEGAKKAVEALKERQKAVSQQANAPTSIWETPNTSGFDIDPGQIWKRQEEKGNEREQGKRLTEELRKAEAEVERLQEELDWRKYFNYADLTQNADFGEKSQYKSTANGKRKVDAWGSFLTGDGGGLVFENSGYDDPLYDWINGDKEAGAALKLEAGERYGAEGGSAGRLWAYSTEGEQQASEMSEEERKIFNYLYATEGKEAAYQYYNQLRKDLNRRQRNTEQEKWAEYAKEHPVGASAFSVMASPLKGLSYGAQAADYLTKGEIDQNAAYNKASYIPSAIRGQVSQMAEDKWGAVGSFAYQTGMSMADFLYNSLLTGSFLGEGVLGKAGAKVANNLSLAIMGTGAAADATMEAKDRGLSDGQAFALGTVAGLAEVITEKVSVEALFNGDWEKGALRYIIKNVVSEGSEEVASDLINLFADVLISKDKSQWQTALEEYKADGKTEEEAFWLAVKDQGLEMGVDFLGGALSGGVMAGAGAAIGSAGTALSQRGEQRKTATGGGNTVAEMNAGGYTEGNNIKREGTTNRQRAESKEDFYRRGMAEGLSYLEGDEGGYAFQRVRYPAGAVAAERYSPAQGIQRELRELGVSSDIIEGELQRNHQGVTTIHNVEEAATADRGHIFINKNTTLNPRNVAGHEAFHLWGNSETRTAYEAVLRDNLIFSGEAFREYQAKATQKYFDGGANLADSKQANLLFEEIFAYISGDLHEGGKEATLREILRDYDAVKAAWEQLVQENGNGNKEVTDYGTEERETDLHRGGMAGSLPNLDGNEGGRTIQRVRYPAGAVAAGRDGAAEGNRTGVSTAARQPRVAEVTAEGSVILPRGGETGEFYLPTAQQEQIMRQAAKAKTETERTGILAGASEEAIAQAQRMGEVIGREIVFYSEAPDNLGNLRNGFYDPGDGRIYVNVQSGNPLAQIVAHELTHSLEESGSYRDLERLVLKRLQGMGALEDLRASYRGLYARAGVELGATEVDREIVAAYVEKHLLTNEGEIRSIVTGNRTLGKQILAFLNQLLGKLGNEAAAERAFLLKARSLYEAALEESRAGAEELSRKRANRQGIEELGEQLRRGEISEEEAEARFNDLYDPEEDLERRERGVRNSIIGGMQESKKELSPTAANENVLSDIQESSKKASTPPVAPAYNDMDMSNGYASEWVLTDAYEGSISSEAENVKKYSISPTFGEEIQDWFDGGSDGRRVFTLGSTGEVLQGLGAIESDIYMNGDKINTILDSHPEMTLREIQRIPEVLEDPVLVLKSKGTGKHRVNSRMVLYGSLKATNGQPVMAVLDLRPTENGLLLDDMQKVNSAYTKDNAAGFVSDSEVMFADKKRTISLLRRFGLTIASRGLLLDGYVGSISYDGDFVKLEGVPFDQVVSTETGVLEPEYSNPAWREAAEAGKKQYSISPTFGEEIQDWFDGGSDGQRVFTLGSTGEVLQGLGAIESDIYMNGDKINTILDSHPEMTLREIQRIPEVLEDPVLVLASKNGNKRNSRLVLFGSLRAQDGRPVMCVLDLRPTDNGLLLDDMQKVTSAYTKDTNPVGFIRDSEVLFADKKRTASLLKSVGFWAPIELQRNGYLGSVTYRNRSVKLEGVPFDQLVDGEEASTGVPEPEYSNPAWREAVEAGKEKQYSISPTFGEEIQDWFDGGSDGRRVFTLGSTGEVLQGLGAIESDIYMNGDKINTILDSHPEMTLREIQRIPEVLEDPVLILKSRNKSRSQYGNGRMVLFGSLKAQDGRPVMCVLDLRPTENGLLLDDMQKVTSAYTKDTNPEYFVRNSEVLFADKKRTTRLLRDVGFMRPASLLLDGYVGSISYDGDFVKLEGVPFDQLVDGEETSTGVLEPEYSNPAWREAVEVGKKKPYSISSTFGEELREWDGKSKRTFRVGTTSEVLQSIGVKDRGIIWHGGKIAEILRKHSGMTLDIIEQVPTVLENPTAVLKSKQSESRIVTFGELTDENGAPVTAVVELRPTTKGGELLDMNVIASAYGKDSSPGRLIQNSDVLYLDENKNRTQKWLQSVGLQLPADTTKLGSVGSIAYRDGAVKIQGVPFDQLMDGEETSTGVLEPEYSNPAWREAVEVGKKKPYSISPTFGEELRDWDEKTEQTFRVGTTSEALQSIGVKDRGIVWHSRKIAEILRKHSGMTLDIIEQVPTVLENPIVVLKSKQSESRIVTFGELTDENGAPVTAVVELLPTTKGGELLDMNVIASAYGKDSFPGRLIQNSDVLYLDENKNRTQKWLQGLGLQLPSDTTKLGSVGSIAYRDGAVKIQGVPFDRLMDGEEASTGVLEPEYSNPAWREAAEAGREQRRKNSISVTEKTRQEKAGSEKASATETEERYSARESVPAKARGQMERTERALVNRLGKALGVPNFGQREYLKPITQEISEEYLQTGQVSQETAERLFDKAYSEGIMVEDEFYRQYKPVKDHLRTQAITISEQDKADIADWKEFRKSTFGTLRIVNKGGVPVDVAYQELMEMAPELFPESVTAPSDQLRKMFDVARSIQKTEVSLEQYYGEDAANFAKWAKNDFESYLGDAVSELRLVKRYAEERGRKAAAGAEVPTTPEEAMQAYGRLKKARWEAEKAKARNLLTDHDRIQVGRLLKGEIEPEHLNPKTDNVRGITAVYEASREYEQLADTLLKYKKAQKANLRKTADDYLKNAGLWKDKKSGILYARETMERNFEDVIGNPEEAKAVIQEYITPVHDMEAKATRYKTEYRDRVRELGLSRKVEKGNEISESHAVQELGEALDNIAMLENSKGRMERRDGLTLDEWRGVVTTLKANNPNMDWGKVNAAIEGFRKIYDEIFERMNKVRVENGYEPINYRRGYFPHFQSEEGEGVLKRFGLALGIDTNVDSLPTTINGLTQNFKPGITWFSHARERKGYRTTYDALQGFDKYIEGAASVIFQTENIQKLRALTSQIRYRTSDEGLQKQVDAVREDETLSEVDKENRIKAIYQDGKFDLSNLAVELDEYTNILAGKKSSGDRNMERMLGRRMYRLMKSWESRVGANMIAGNLSSALTNFIPLTQAGAQIDSGTLLKGMWDTLKAYKNDDGFADMSSFLTNRRGSDPVVKSWSQEVSEKLGKPMEFIDTFTSDSIVRARYAQNLKRGMSEAAAMSEADAFAGKVMADRSKGSMPTLFSQSNPITKAFTQFQLEVNNQFSEVFKDLPKIYRDKGLKAFAVALIKYFLGAYLFNEVYEFFVGRRPALDPIGILNDTAGDLTGYELPNLVKLGTGAVSGDLPSFQTEKVGLGEAGGNLAENVLGELPFSAGLGLIGVETDGGRVPAASAVPDLAALWDAATTEGWSGKKRWKEVQDELNKLAYIIPPFGGNQVQKIVKSAKTLAQGGSYTVDSEGADRLQYPVFANSAWQEAANFTRMMAFGKNSLPEAQDWVENGFNTLSAKETTAYQEMVRAGAEREEAYTLLTSMKGMAKTNEKRTAIMESPLTDEEKEIAYRYILGSKQEDGSYASSREDDILAFREVGLDFDRFLEAQNRYTDIGKEYQTAGEKATAFSRWVNQQNYTARQAETVRECFGYYSQMKVGTRYDTFVSAGLDDGTAYRLTTTLNALEPEDGKETVSNLQKYRAILDDGLSDAKTMTALSAVMPESEYAKLEVGNEFGVTAAAYVIFKEQLPRYDEDGNGSYSQEEVEKAIDSLGYRNGIMLPGGKKTAESIELTREEKAALWQMANKAWKGSSNPYSKKVGKKVYEALNAE